MNKSRKIVQDSQFLNNIKGALANDINVGIYFFTGAATEEEAIEEARWTVNMIKNYNITFPVAIDSELFNDSFGTDPGFDYRLQNVSNSQLTTNAIAFSNYIKSEGYTPMIYSYANALTNKFETARFGSNRVWLAQYNDKPTYKGKYYMWQYTSNGSVPGINTRVDMNVAYFSVTNDVTKASSIEGVNSTNLNNLSFNDVNINTTLKKDVVLRNSNYNKVANLNSGTAIKITGISSSYIKVVYDLETYYIEDTNCFNIPSINFNNIDLNATTNKEVTLYDIANYINGETAILQTNSKINVIGYTTEYTKIKYNNKEYIVKDVDFYNVDSDLSLGSSKEQEESTDTLE